MPTLEAASEQTSDAAVSPVKLAHIVLRTARFEELVNWYKAVLNARVVYDDGGLAFLCYDDEHHRVAVINVPGVGPQPEGIAGVHHFAFTYAGLGDLLKNYMRLKDLGILPVWSVNHGPTTSMYYADPDQNQVELQVDNYDTVEEAGEFMFTPAFNTNPIGVDFDPEELYRRYQAGEDERALKMRPASGPRGVDGIRLR